MKLLKNTYVNTKENFKYKFIKNNYEYKIYIYKNIITIEKEDIKSEKFSIKSYEIT